MMTDKPSEKTAKGNHIFFLSVVFPLHETLATDSENLASVRRTRENMWQAIDTRHYKASSIAWAYINTLFEVLYIHCTFPFDPVFEVVLENKSGACSRVRGV